MKKSLPLLVAVLVIMALAMGKAWAGHFTDVLPPASASGCVPVSNGYDYQCTTDTSSPVIISTSPAQFGVRSIAQINSLAPSSANQAILCSNCVQSAICVSSGTGAGAWVVASATGTFVSGSYPHCQ